MASKAYLGPKEIYMGSLQLAILLHGPMAQCMEASIQNTAHVGTGQLHLCRHRRVANVIVFSSLGYRLKRHPTRNLGTSWALFQYNIRSHQKPGLYCRKLQIPQELHPECAVCTIPALVSCLARLRLLGHLLRISGLCGRHHAVQGAG